MKKGKVNVSFDKSENDFVLSWKDENGGVYLVTIEASGDKYVMVSFSSKKLSEGWREFVKLEEKND